jgi:hypothetical protein
MLSRHLDLDFQGAEPWFGGLIDAFQETVNSFRLEIILDDLRLDRVGHGVDGNQILDVHGAPSFVGYSIAERQSRTSQTLTIR